MHVQCAVTSLYCQCTSNMCSNKSLLPGLCSGPRGIQGSVWSGHTAGGVQRLWAHLQGVPAHEGVWPLPGWQGDQGGCVSTRPEGRPVPADSYHCACLGGGAATAVLRRSLLWLHVWEQPHLADVSWAFISLASDFNFFWRFYHALGLIICADFVAAF